MDTRTARALDAHPLDGAPLITFNRPHLTGSELAYIADAAASGHLSGNGQYAELCTEWLRARTGHPALLTHSASGALEMAVALAEVGPGDEVIMPSFNFVSSANAVAARGGVPVFVDVDAATLNIDPERVADAVTDATVAIMPTHYAGVGCDMAALGDITDEHGLWLIEDAAQGILATHNGSALGTFGDAGALSFHETKNVHCGEGGAILMRPELLERAEVIHEKGTDRSRFHRGEVDRYTWQDIGSSYLMSEVSAAFLWAQLEHADELAAERRWIWDSYHIAFRDLPITGPTATEHNAHIYWLLLPNDIERTVFIATLAERGIMAVSHYVPLHSSPAGSRYGRVHGDMAVTDSVADRLVRLPLWVGMSEAEILQVITAVREAVEVRVAA